MLSPKSTLFRLTAYFNVLLSILATLMLVLAAQKHNVLYGISGSMLVASSLYLANKIGRRLTLTIDQ